MKTTILDTLHGTRTTELDFPLLIQTIIITRESRNASLCPIIYKNDNLLFHVRNHHPLSFRYAIMV